MGDINTYAGEFLLDFVDALHNFLADELNTAFGEDWIEKGIRKHLQAQYFDRARKMLESPMRVVDMGKTDEELYGIEHVRNIVQGNWALFEDTFEHRQRTEVYLDEIAELRHNLSHRRRRHMLTKTELVRLMQNMTMLLRAMKSPETSRFERATETLTSGANPWGPSIATQLPNPDEIVTDFVGRQGKLAELREWFASDRSQLVVFGYGGAGKSATAYQFVRDLAEASPDSLTAICWVSAKREEFVEGTTRKRLPDFTDVQDFAERVWEALYGAQPPSEGDARQSLVQELSETPILLVIDDLDTVLQQEALAEFLIYELRETHARIIYTSRQRIPGLRTIEIEGFEEAELERFIKNRCSFYGLNYDDFGPKVASIASVTDSYPLFVDDLVRYAQFAGLKSALEDWSQRRGDAARQYALRRQLDSLGRPSEDALIAIAVARRATTLAELGTISGQPDDDLENAIESLQRWRLVNRIPAAAEAQPGFDVNQNTRRLVEKSFARDARWESFGRTFANLTAKTDYGPRRQAIGAAISYARSLVLRGSIEEAATVLQSAMTGDLSQSSDLWGALGWVYSREPNRWAQDARDSFRQAHDLGAVKEDTYVHWAQMEVALAEALPQSTEAATTQWAEAAQIAEMGLDLLSADTQSLCWLAGYARSRLAKSLLSQNEFNRAYGEFSRSATWLQRALDVDPASGKLVDRGTLFRGLVIAYEGASEFTKVDDVMEVWGSWSGRDAAWQSERDRLAYRRGQTP